MAVSRALAIAAHPDDIEFCMAGTLLLLKKAGWQIHYLNLSSGNCGSMEHGPARTRAIRRREAQRAAALLGACYHPSLGQDLEILYELPLLRRLAAVVRDIAPSIVLTHSPQDYMEDHVNTSRLTVTAAFARGMPNFQTVPARHVTRGDVTVYHAMPHGLRDGLRRRVHPEFFVDTTGVHRLKREALAAHASQKAWLDATQGMDSYLQAMDALSLELGQSSRRFKHAEGWRRHLHLGFSGKDIDPLGESLSGKIHINQKYSRSLK